MFAKASGYLQHGGDIYSFIQDFVYSDQNGTVSKSRIQGGFNIKEKTLNTQVRNIWSNSTIVI